MPNDSQEIVSIEESEITPDQRYSYFVEELRSMIIASVLTSRIEIVRSKWGLGKRVIEEQDNFERGIYGQRTVDGIAKDLRISTPSLYKAIQFYRAYPAESFDEILSTLPYGNNISWYKITKELLPSLGYSENQDDDREQIQGEVVMPRTEDENCEHTLLVCKKCGRTFAYEEFLEIVRGNEE